MPCGNIFVCQSSSDIKHYDSTVSINAEKKLKKKYYKPTIEVKASIKTTVDPFLIIIYFKHIKENETAATIK